MKRRGIFRLAAFLVISMLTMGQTWAGTTTHTTQNTVTNAVTTGKVKIQIQEKYDPEEGKNLVPSPPDHLKKITKTVKIGNLAAPAFVRVRFDKVWGTGQGQHFQPCKPPLDTDNIQLFFKEDTAWQLINDGTYDWYYVSLAEGAVSDTLLESFAFVAGDHDQDYVGKVAHINVIAEAIQTKNNALESTWQVTYGEGNQTFTQLTEPFKGEPAVIQVATETTKICFTGDTHVTGIGFEESQQFPIGGLFTNFNDLYPGDRRQQTITLVNETRKSAVYQLVMKAATQDETLEEAEDLEAIREKVQELLYNGLVTLKITATDGTVIYNGPVGGNEGTLTTQPGTYTTGYLTLGTLEGRRQADIVLDLTVSPEMDESYQALLAKVDWMLQAKWTEGESSGPTSDPDGSDDPDDKPHKPSPTPSEEPEATPTPTPSVGPEETPGATDELAGLTPSDEGTSGEKPAGDNEAKPIPGQQTLPKTGGPLPLILLILGILCIGGGYLIKRQRTHQ